MEKERTTEEQKRAVKTAKCFLIVAGIILLLIILMPGDRKKEADPAPEPPTAAEKRSEAKTDKSPAEEKEDTDKTNAIKAALQPLLDETIGKTADYYTIDVSKKLVSINVSYKNMAYCALAAKTNDEMKKQWDDMASTYERASQNVHKLVQTIDPDMNVTISLLNDMNNDKFLLMTLNDAIIYNVVDE